MVTDTRSSIRQSGTTPLGSSSYVWTDYSSHPPAPPSTCVPSTVRTPALDATHSRHPPCGPSTSPSTHDSLETMPDQLNVDTCLQDKAGRELAARCPGRPVAPRGPGSPQPKFAEGEFGLGGEPAGRRQHAAAAFAGLISFFPPLPLLLSRALDADI
ncbi:hypothetical protein HETIRDRAFT_450276 [Heterobasidion irregulare TC 32-1]|uniref:Uncharacterized protein n=1 Tax=Heterobasidion irregulare (strain TC 32-1) TaxID=747525 RepID=W4K9F2_HETIT|nr:uncharacterized protein HETIRDRAFT_450276 [Heterobasidion irregulare TC 32-1]ETW82359.1 hypothetical protein HETIRDRAFT_450276 [Heterobasidion irregulare TC 32-1]